jgi:hypothetical protein
VEPRPFGDTPFAKTGTPRNFVMFAQGAFFSVSSIVGSLRGPVVGGGRREWRDRTGAVHTYPMTGFVSTCKVKIVQAFAEMRKASRRNGRPNNPIGNDLTEWS